MTRIRMVATPHDKPTVAVSKRSDAIEFGRSLRESMPRRGHAEWPPAAERNDPVDTIDAECRTLLPSLVPLRVARMTSSPFAFFRGAAAVMADDCAALPTTGIEIQICGDAHLANFGIYATPERSLVFDVNDFDETMRGSWEWDVKRFATSVVLAGRQAGYSAGESSFALQTSLQTYVNETRHHARVPVLESWYDHLDADDIEARVGGQDRAYVERQVERARVHTSLDLFPKMTVVTIEGASQIAERPPLIARVEAPQREAVAAVAQSYRASLPEEPRA